ncbi:MAG TPA: flagellar basal body P-ring protein FlgI, partial [Bryobacteraceae bacterium]
MKYLLLLALLATSTWAAVPERGTRLKDLVTIEGVRSNQLVGYGLVVG